MAGEKRKAEEASVFEPPAKHVKEDVTESDEEENTSLATDTLKNPYIPKRKNPTRFPHGHKAAWDRGRAGFWAWYKKNWSGKTTDITFRNACKIIEAALPGDPEAQAYNVHWFVEKPDMKTVGFILQLKAGFKKTEKYANWDEYIMAVADSIERKRRGIVNLIQDAGIFKNEKRTPLILKIIEQFNTSFTEDARARGWYDQGNDRTYTLDDRLNHFIKHLKLNTSRIGLNCLWNSTSTFDSAKDKPKKATKATPSKTDKKAREAVTTAEQDPPAGESGKEEEKKVKEEAPIGESVGESIGVDLGEGELV